MATQVRPRRADAWPELPAQCSVSIDRLGFQIGLGKQIRGMRRLSDNRTRLTVGRFESVLISTEAHVKVNRLTSRLLYLCARRDSTLQKL